MHGNQEFFFNIDTLSIYHPISNQCLDSSVERKELFMNPCSKNKQTQQWKFEHFNETMIRKDFKFKS
jgi:polypeptide N-acetylgalactosaminyltransferase